MFPFLAERLTPYWGPFRLLESYLVLIGIGALSGAILSWYCVQRYKDALSRDRGKPLAQHPDAAKGKPTGAGLIVVSVIVPLLALVMPFSPQLWGIVICLGLAMLSGFLDDRSIKPWGELRKGLLDLGITVVAALAISGGEPMPVWIPLWKDTLTLSGPVYLAVAAGVLWLSINATNCSDGVDGLAGSLTLLSLFFLGGLLYGVIGHTDIADYLLVPHNPDGAKWAILVFTSAGALAGYLWHNAKPSAVLMGDAGSRFLGLLVGVAVLVTGNPFLILVAAPIVLVNGGTGLVKLVALRVFRKLGFDVRPPQQNGQGEPPKPFEDQHVLIRALHSVRFPLHDHCRRNLYWSDTQVLMRFVLLQTFITPVLLVIFLKVR